MSSSTRKFRRGLEGMPEPELDKPHDHKFGELHEFTVRSFKWEGKPDEKKMLDSIEEIVESFIEEYISPAEVIIARFNTDNNISENEADRLFLNLQSAIVAIEEEVTRRYLKAQFSYYMLDDKYQAAYVKPASGTSADLNARARLETKDDRYFYFVQYSAWRMIQDKVNSLKATQRMIQQRIYRRSSY